MFPSILTILPVLFWPHLVHSFCDENFVYGIMSDNKKMYEVKEESAKPTMNCLVEDKHNSDKNNCTQLDEEKEMFYLLTMKNQNDHQNLITGDGEVLEKSHFNKSSTTVFLFHGWLGSYKDSKIVQIAKAHVEHTTHNVILINWHKYSTIWYQLSTKYIKHVAKQTANFVVFLKNSGVDPEKMHFIGFNVGGHVASYAAEILKDTEKFKIGRLTGLDVASPWVCKPDLRKYFVKTNMNESLASFVDCLHTSPWGFRKPRCHADFYPDGGITQKTCDPTNDLLWVCSHPMVCYYYAKSIAKTDRYMGRKCEDLNEMTTNKDCHGTKAPMGFGTPADTSGIYYVDSERGDLRKKSSAVTIFVTYPLKFLSIILIVSI